MTSLNHSPSISPRLNLSKSSEEIECQLENTLPARLATSKQTGFHPEDTSPTASASFKPNNCDFNESETVGEHRMRQNQRPVPWTSSPIVRTNTALILAEPTEAPNRKQLDRNRCKTLDFVSPESDGIEDDPLSGAVRSTDAKISLAAPKDLRPRSTMDRIKRLFNPHGKKCRANPKEGGGNALAKGEERDPGGWAATKDHGGDQGKQGDGVMIHHSVNKAGSDPLGINTVLETERNRTTEDRDRRYDVSKERSRNQGINIIESAAGHCKQNWRHGWMSKKQRKSGESYPVVEVHSGQDSKVQSGAMLSACLMQASSTSPADETMPIVAFSQKIHGENVLNSEMVDNTKGSAPRISPTDEDLFIGKQREVLSEAGLNRVPEPSCSKDLARNPSSEILAAKSLARIQSIENVERWLMHGYQAPRHTKSRQHVSRRSRRNYLYYMSHYRSSISSSEYAISPTDDHHRCAWEHCQSEKGFGSNDSYCKNKNCGQPPCDDVNIKSKVKMCHRSHEGTLFDADGTSRDGEARHQGIETGRDACQNQSGDASLLKLNPSLLQFVAELVEGLEKAKQNESEWSTQFMEKTSTPVLPRVTNLANENLASVSRRHCCSRSSAEHALNPMFHEANLLQNQNAEQPTNSLEGCHIKHNIAGPSEEGAIYSGTRCVRLKQNCDHENPSEKYKKGEILNRPASLSGTGVVHRCTVEQKRTFSLNRLLDDFNSLNIDPRLLPQLNKILPLGRASSPSLLRQCLLQSMEGKPEILSARQVMPTTASGEDVLQQEKTEIVGHQPFAQLSSGILPFTDKIE